MKAWLLLLLAGVLEIFWATGLKYTQGFTRPWPSLMVLITALVSFYLLAMVIRDLPAGTAYAIWAGIVTIGVAIAGMVLFDEPVSAVRIFFILLVVTGIMGLKWFSPVH